MTQTRSIQTKALSAYFQSRGMTVIAALAQIGVTDYPTILANETISDDLAGRLARRYGLTFERLAELVAMHA